LTKQNDSDRKLVSNHLSVVVEKFEEPTCFNFLNKFWFGVLVEIVAGI